MRRAWPAALLIGAAAGAALAADDGPSAEGSLAWISSDRLSLIGTISADVPIAESGRWRVAVAARAMTAIERVASSFTFVVDRVSYTAQLSARRVFARGDALELFAGEQGVEQVDAPGSARVRLVGAGWESPGYRRAFGPFGWSGRVSAAPVLEHHGVDAFFSASGAVRYLHKTTRRRGIAVGADATVDALFGRDGGADVAIGPRMEFDLAGDRRFGVFLRWQRARNPLGVSADGLLLGFDFAEGSYSEGPRPVPPEISGSCFAGTGEERRGVARLDLHVASPPFLSGTYAEIEVAGNILTADDLNDLYYTYDVGVAHPLSSWRAGAWFHHRSNHVAGGLNETVTSINVFEGGVDSAGWDRAEPSGLTGRAGSLDARLRAGWLIDSAFPGDARWHARGGARWAFPALRRVRFYLSADFERGRVAASRYAAGALLPRGWDLRIEVLHDEQLFSADPRARVVLAGLRY